MAVDCVEQEPFRGIKRGLCAYVTYQMACQMEQSFSEYSLYEPILRILVAGGYSVECEVALGKKVPRRGDHKRLDFVAKPLPQKGDLFCEERGSFALEVKWVKELRPKIKPDLKKLTDYRTQQGGEAFLCVFGQKHFIEGLELGDANLGEVGRLVCTNFGKSRNEYSCRIFDLK